MPEALPARHAPASPPLLSPTRRTHKTLPQGSARPGAAARTARRSMHSGTAQRTSAVGSLVRSDCTISSMLSTPSPSVSSSWNAACAAAQSVGGLVRRLPGYGTAGEGGMGGRRGSGETLCAWGELVCARVGEWGVGWGHVGSSASRQVWCSLHKLSSVVQQPTEARVTNSPRQRSSAATPTGPPCPFFL